MEHAELLGRALADIDNALLERAAVIHPHIGNAVVLHVYDLEHRPHRQFWVRGGVAVRVENFFVFGKISFESGAVPACRAPLQFFGTHALCGFGWLNRP